MPERLIGAESAFYLRWLLDHWSATQGALAVEAVAEYQRRFDEAAIRATCEEFRTAATIDLIHDEADRGHKISCPTLLLWSATSMWASYDILEVWRSRAEDVKGGALDGGHFLPEESGTNGGGTNPLFIVTRRCYSHLIRAAGHRRTSLRRHDSSSTME